MFNLPPFSPESSIQYELTRVKSRDTAASSSDGTAQITRRHKIDTQF
jgi:hypothetical protein